LSKAFSNEKVLLIN